MTDFALKPRWDIFCKIVDNFGDIGVSWRLAQQLQNEHELQVRLWVDNLSIAQKIIPTINIKKYSQIIDNIEILFFNSTINFTDAADVVIETFSCGLPENYLQLMSKKPSKWVNLEYLSAENWVADFHAKPSPQPQLNLTRHFYFPGFTEKTGGLLREKNLLPRYSDFLRNDGEGIKISLFCYPHTSIRDLFTALQTNLHAVSVYVPESSILPQIADYFGVEAIDVGDSFTRDNLHVHILPFLSQADYDALLRDCDLNFVRGEDSWLRAIWAGKPFIWQPYVQEENTHLKKLESFLSLFYADFEQKEILCNAHEYWAAGHMSSDVLNDYLNNLNTLKTYTLQQSQQLAKQPDLATKLVDFCNNL